jgi:hypothetical protein
MIRNHIALGASLTSIVLILQVSPPAKSQREQEVQLECQSAVQEAIQTLERGRDLTVIKVNSSDVSRRYITYPTDSTLGLHLFLRGSAVEHVLRSPVFMSNISTQMMNQCGPLSLVAFHQDQSDWFVTFGWMDGRAVKFDCLDEYTGQTYWGETFCP